MLIYFPSRLNRTKVTSNSHHPPNLVTGTNKQRSNEPLVCLYYLHCYTRKKQFFGRYLAEI